MQGVGYRRTLTSPRAFISVYSRRMSLLWSSQSSSYKGIAKRKQEERYGKLAAQAVHTVSVEVREAMVKASPAEIVQHIESGDWTAVDVLEAYIQRVLLAQETTNCVTEVLFDEARVRARELDKTFADTGKICGPLHGVPVSIKDCYDIAGHDSSIGLTKFTDKKATEDAAIVSVIRKCGGILYVKTNTCQTMMTFECDNPIWGRTLSPHNEKYTCGGSTGGEAVLLAMDASPLGWGSDIGGSLRIPAGYCGVYSFKPSPNRISIAGHASTLHGFEHIADAAGPMGRSVADLELACRLVFGQGRPKDVTPLPYRDVKLPEKLQIGYYVSDGYVKASPACRRAVMETVKALKNAGHECVPIIVPDPSAHVELYVGFLAADGYKTLLGAVKPDPVDPGLFLTTLGPKLPGWVRWLASYVGRKFFKDELFARSIESARGRSVYETWQLVEKREEYKKQFYTEVWDKHGLDGIIAPVQAIPQAPHGTCTTASFLACATILYNVLSLPAGVIPVTRVDPKADAITPEWSDPQSEGHGSPLFERALYGKGGIYDPEGMAGLPVSVQVVGRQWDDEKVIGMMHVVERALGPRGFGPGSWKGQKSSTT